MKLRRRSRTLTALIALACMLFMQLAVAGYVCPGMALDHLAAPAADSMGAMAADMEGCVGMDKVQPNLCFEHHQAGSHSLDKPELPQVQPFLAGSAVVLDPASAFTGAPLMTPAHALQLTRATSPPLSIQHCCFRI